MESSSTKFTIKDNRKTYRVSLEETETGEVLIRLNDIVIGELSDGHMVMVVLTHNERSYLEGIRFSQNGSIKTSDKY